MSSATPRDPVTAAGEGAPFAETLLHQKAVPGPVTPAKGEQDTGTKGVADTPQGQQPQAPPQTNLVGQVFGDFELVEEIGRGGMGVVFKARQRSLDRIVAFKMLPAEHFHDPKRLERFLGEARIAAGLGHPNIVQIYQVGECPAGHFFAMEFIEGHSLQSLVEAKLPIPGIVSLLITVAEAVHYAHTRGIIHRDLKPANIMIDRFRRPIVTDFGIAKFLGKSSSLTAHGMIMGTPTYMSPEQAGDTPELIGPYSDVYSLGAILYTLLTGHVPYDEGTALRTILKVIGPDMPPPVSSLRREVPAELERIVTKCLSKNFRDRYPTARELADDLRRFKQALSRKEPTPAPPTKELPLPSATKADTPLATKRPPRESVPGTSRLPSVTLVMTATGKELQLTRPKTVLGRAKDCGIVVRASDISKHHCQILLSVDQVVVEDLGSSNGTFVNGKRVQCTELHNGDQLALGDCVFQVRMTRGRE